MVKFVHEVIEGLDLVLTPGDFCGVKLGIFILQLFYLLV
jgi:hypothetical protein